VLIVPSLINPPRILDLDEQVSLTKAIASMGRHVLSVDWGTANERADLTVGGHIENLLLPLLRSIEHPPALIGYCLGGTMAIAAANLTEVECVATIASPWQFSRYPQAARDALRAMWEQARPAAHGFNALPMEVLQAAFWSLDPDRTVKKFAKFARLDPASPKARRFVQLEDWANEGEPLPYAAALELIEDLFNKDLPGSGAWSVGGVPATDQLQVPVLHLVAERDRIAPAETAPSGPCAAVSAGHVGMVVGSQRDQLHRALAGFLKPGCR
jgi:polyhydroxyalkanoate synthase